MGRRVKNASVYDNTGVSGWLILHEGDVVTVFSSEDPKENMEADVVMIKQSDPQLWPEKR